MTPAALAALHAAAFVTPAPWSATEIAGTLAAPGTFLLTAPQGFLIGRALAGEAELLTLAVHPDARRRGTGRGLVADFLAAAQARTARRAFLEVAADNPAARALYTAAGFVPAGRRPGYFAAPDGRRIDAIIMARDLPVS